MAVTSITAYTVPSGPCSRSVFSTSAHCGITHVIVRTVRGCWRRRIGGDVRALDDAGRDALVDRHRAVHHVPVRVDVLAAEHRDAARGVGQLLHGQPAMTTYVTRYVWEAVVDAELLIVSTVDVAEPTTVDTRVRVEVVSTQDTITATGAAE